MQNEKPTKFITHSFQEWITEMKNEIKFPLMNLLVYYCEECLTDFDCNKSGIRNLVSESDQKFHRDPI